MRYAILFLLTLPFAACATSEIDEPPPPAPTTRERLEHEGARLAISPAEMGGTIRAEYYSGSGTWTGAPIDLEVERGIVGLRAGGQAIVVEDFALGFAPIEIPESLIGTRAELVNLRVALATPVVAMATWSSDDEHATLAARVDLALSWAIRVDGTMLELGMPTLPPIPIELAIDGERVAVRLAAAGELWNWAGLLRLADLYVDVATRK